ncbi:uncharacterized protein LOC114936016 [Nylanderia fulva]|uniref:uncharacterized protein LOC114936016 n=1 Tax=Nylanderia fulva TaxID=613905 RepID=UPI0010FB15B1|nr:uncharacterized protein LOC114936016 [Nylanderia fulva]
MAALTDSIRDAENIIEYLAQIKEGNMYPKLVPFDNIVAHLTEAAAQLEQGYYFPFRTHTARRSLANFKKLGRSNWTPAKIRSRLASLQETWNQCVRNHAILIQLVPEEDRDELDYFKDDQFAAHEDIYQTAKDFMNECLEEVAPVVSHDSSTDTTFSRSEPASFSLKHLPPIKLPPFSGKSDEWETFLDRFQALIIDNRDLSEFSKMHFLVSSLTGSARDAIAGIKVIADNFQVAWKALTVRFENKRRLIETHLSTLYHLPKMTRESAVELHALRDKTEQVISTLNRLDRSSDDIVSDLLVYFISQKFDSATRRAWKLKTSDSDDPPTYKELTRFLSSRALALEELHSYESDKSKLHSKVTSATATASFELSCSMCKQQHIFSKCPQFVSKSPHQRRELVKKFRRCFNCLSKNHSVNDCQSKFTCRFCSKKHHTMIHMESDSLRQTNSNVSNAHNENENAASVAALTSITLTTAPTPVVLSTAKVNLRAPSGRSLTVRALLDGGSELTFISERVAQNLRLTRIRTFTSTTGISCVNTGICRSAALIYITPRDKPEPIFTTVAYIMKSLTRYAPRSVSNLHEWKHISNLKLADDDPTGSTQIDLIIGADLYNQVLINVQNGPVGQPGAIQSHFGWILSGTTSVPSHIEQNTCVVGSTFISSLASNKNQGSRVSRSNQRYQVVAHHCSLEYQLRKFGRAKKRLNLDNSLPRIRAVKSTSSELTREQQMENILCVFFFAKTFQLKIGESREIAARRLSSLIHKLKSQPSITSEYCEFMRDYEDLGHMQPVSPVETHHSQVVYIPHHPVIREASSTTRLRVVFDASCKTTNGTSLNDHMLKGPKLQTDLQAVILRWRQYKFVYSADLAKMYRQILVDPRDRDYQRILWIDSNSNIQEYQLLTVTYGTASAPFLALRVINQLNEDEGPSFPLASAILRDNIYVDDVLFGANDICS